MATKRPDNEGRSMPKGRLVREYWKESNLSEFLNTSGANDKSCMACGGYGNHRAHILALCYGGSNLPSNIHMLCQSCHVESELLDGYNYWLWLKCKSTLFHKGTDMTYEMDYNANEELHKYSCESEYLSKVKAHVKEYQTLSLFKGWTLPQVWSKINLIHSSELGFSFGNINTEEIDEVIEMNNTILEEIINVIG